MRGLSSVSTFHTSSDFRSTDSDRSCVLPCITVVVVTSDEDTAGERTAEDSVTMADEKVTQVSELTPALLQTVLRRSLASPALTVSR